MFCTKHVKGLPLNKAQEIPLLVQFFLDLSTGISVTNGNLTYPVNPFPPKEGVPTLRTRNPGDTLFNDLLIHG